MEDPLDQCFFEGEFEENGWLQREHRGRVQGGYWRRPCEEVDTVGIWI
jgi:hypothetical protein